MSISTGVGHFAQYPLRLLAILSFKPKLKTKSKHGYSQTHKAKVADPKS